MTVCCVSPREVIAVSQDALGVQGRLVKSSAGVWLGEDRKVRNRKVWAAEKVRAQAEANYRVYSRPLSDHAVAVALLNTHSFSYPHNITFAFKDVRDTIYTGTSE